ncbi:MAG: hypothetical protein JWL76_1373 [Thermoleophilia bacterium]|nr:hypothetical protein [Thermoleophilia bacterium]
MRCPVCTTALSTGTHEGRPIAGCATCSGRFVSYESLRGILADVTKPRPGHEHATAMASAGTAATVEGDGRPPLACPECDDPMRRYVHQYASGVWVDSCEVHGIWLDAGELERLEAYAEAAATGMSPTNTANVANSDVGMEPARIATSGYAMDELPTAGRGASTGFGLDILVPGHLGIFTLLGQIADGAGAWRAMDASDAARREQAMVDAAKRDIPPT